MENNEIEFHKFFSNFEFHVNGTDEKKELTSHSTRIIMITVLMSTMYDNNEKCFLYNQSITVKYR